MRTILFSLFIFISNVSFAQLAELQEDFSVGLYDDEFYEYVSKFNDQATSKVLLNALLTDHWLKFQSENGVGLTRLILENSPEIHNEFINRVFSSDRDISHEYTTMFLKEDILKFIIKRADANQKSYLIREILPQNYWLEVSTQKSFAIAKSLLIDANDTDLTFFVMNSLTKPHWFRSRNAMALLEYPLINGDPSTVGIVESFLFSNGEFNLDAKDNWKARAKKALPEGASITALNLKSYFKVRKCQKKWMQATK